MLKRVGLSKNDDRKAKASPINCIICFGKKGIVGILLYFRRVVKYENKCGLKQRRNGPITIRGLIMAN